jgi:hypothetical protein
VIVDEPQAGMVLAPQLDFHRDLMSSKALSFSWNAHRAGNYHSACLQARRRVRPGSDKRSIRSHRPIVIFQKSETRISAGMGAINTRVTVLSMTWVGGTTTSGRASEVMLTEGKSELAGTYASQGAP